MNQAHTAPLSSEASTGAASSAQATQIASELTTLFGDRCLASPSTTSQYLATEGHASTTPPRAVVLPETREEVQFLHRLAAQFGCPLIPFGSGTSVEGQVAAGENSICVDMRRLNRVLDIDTESMTVTVEAGITRVQLDAELRDTGLFFPVDPGADATLGGMAATRASGTNAVRYGTMKDNVLAARVVLANGEELACGTAAMKSASGYDLLHLFIGSEGTLGTFTELTLRLHPRPECVAGAAFCFPDVASAVDAVVLFRHAAIPVARVELFDPVTVGALNRHSGLDLPESPLLLLELHGTASAVAEQFDVVRELVSDIEGTTTLHADDRDRRDQLWKSCHRRYYACRALRPGAEAIATDVCVPISKLADTVEATLADIATLPMPATLHGHVGDGNFHTVILLDPGDAQEVEVFERYSERLVLRAVEAGGTCTGEHGVGIGKQKYLAREHGTSLAWMQAVKRLFDPKGVMNPGKHIDVPAS